MADAAEPVARDFASQRLRLNYLDWGNDAAPPLLLVHGGEDHARSWDWVARALRDDWHVVAPDMRGHGDSEWSPDATYTMEALAADLDALVAHLGGGPVSIVAHSYGGAAALRYAGMFPDTVRRLAAIEGLAFHRDRFADTTAADRIALWAKWIERRRTMGSYSRRAYPSVEAAAARLYARNPRLTPAHADHLARWGMRAADAGGGFIWKFDPWFRAQMPTDASDGDRTAFWGAITCPVLLFHGQESWASNPAEDGRAALFQDARVVSLPDAGHWVQHDRFDAFVAEVRAFLGGRPG